MSFIKIITQEITIDIVSETLTIREENNALIPDFKVAHSSRPFLIVENKKTVKALGPRDITSINKKKVVTVDVIEMGKKYVGQLQVISYINGYRKCNLRYASDILNIFNTNISEFMPVVSVIPGASSPVPYQEEAPAVINGWQHWKAYAESFINQSWPNVKWQFPQMNWKHKFGADLEQDDPWYSFQNKINGFNEDEFVENTFEENDDETFTVQNRNVVSPQVYVLSPLYYALKSIGWKLSGDFPAHALIQRLLFLSTKDNMCAVELFTEATNIIFDGNFSSWTPGFPPKVFQRKREIFTPDSAADYFVKYRFVLPLQSLTPNQSPKTTFRARIMYQGNVGEEFVAFNAKNNALNEVFEGEFSVSLVPGLELYLEYSNMTGLMPVEYEVTVRKANEDKTFHQMHPTIETGRFVPSWTFGDSLSQLKKLFNLKIDIDDLRKELIMNFADDFVLDVKRVILNKSFRITSYDQVPYEAFVLKYNNAEDSALYVTTSGSVSYTNQESDYEFTIESKFKYVPHDGSTAVLSETLEEKDGTGLMIYASENSPCISPDVEGLRLAIPGPGGIYETFWLATLKFRLRASVLEVSGALTETELLKIRNINKLYFDNQAYIVHAIDYSATRRGNMLVRFKLESINY